LARLDESREGALIQVVDVAQAAERKIHPKRGLISVLVTFATLVLLVLYVSARQLWGSSPAASRS
jgi:uncharacterized protein involved in exopolysaccharide biosynthesis